MRFIAIFVWHFKEFEGNVIGPKSLSRTAVTLNALFFFFFLMCLMHLTNANYNLNIHMDDEMT